MTDQPIGPILDGLGVTIDLDDGELVESALVITKLVNADGQVLLGLHGSDSMSWLEKLGLIQAAKQRVSDAPWSEPDD
jgi:acyl-CoA hydrolase